MGSVLRGLTATTLAALLAAAGPVAAKTKKGKAKPPRAAPAAAATPQPVAAPPTAAAPAKAVEVPATLAPAALLEAAKKGFDNLDYEQVLPYTDRLLRHPDATLEQRIDGQLMRAQVVATIGDPLDAEAAFLYVLRERPDFDLPADTAPKILAVLRKVQVEERDRHEREKEARRQQLLAQLQLQGTPPAAAEGGLPVDLRFDLVDPQRVVQSMSVLYRRRGEPNFSQLALRADDTGWAGSIPGEWTANDNGFVIEWLLTSAGPEGMALVHQGEPNNPLAIEVAPGQVPDTTPFYQTVWFWVLTVGGAAALGAAAGVGYYAYEQAVQLPGDSRPISIE